MTEESWDDLDTNTSTSNQEQRSLGYGRGRPLNVTNPEPQKSQTNSFQSSFGGTFSKANENQQGGFSSGNLQSRNTNDFNNQGNNRRGFNSDAPFRSGNDGNSRACFNCNQSGHMARECPEPRNNNRPPPRQNQGPPSGGGFQSFGSNSSGRGFQSSGSNSSGGGFQSSSSNSFGGGFQNSGSNSSGGGFQSSGSNSFGGGFQSSGSNSSGGGFQSSGFGKANDNHGSGQNTFGSGTQGNFGSNSDERDENRGFRESRTFRSNRQDRSDFNDNDRNSNFRSSGGAGPSGTREFFRSNVDNHQRNEQNNFKDFHSETQSEQKRVERYVPPDAPTTEEDLFSRSTLRGGDVVKHCETRVKCTPEGLITPIDAFQDAPFQDNVFRNIQRVNFDEPMPIQRYAIPTILNDYDLMACAQTGSGKTGAFLLPIISRLLKDYKPELGAANHPPSPLCLIVSPTRELALQTENEARKFAYNTPIKACSAIGGRDTASTYANLCRGCDILSVTTGRLMDMVHRGQISLAKVAFFILDEADRMLDEGFEQDVKKIQSMGLPPNEKRCTSMFSATFPENVQNLARQFLRQNYIFLVVGTMGVANEDISQTIEEVPASNKKTRLFELLEKNLKEERCLIFVEEKRSADYLGSLLSQKDWMSTTMHGDRTQQQRESTIRDFSNGKCRILVATSVAARGLDFPMIGYVINYDLPSTSDFYIHRIGRTGRAGHTGKSISFFDPDRRSDQQIAPALITQLEGAGQKVPDFLKRYSSGGTSGNSFHTNDTRYHSNEHQRGAGGARSQFGHSSAGQAYSGDFN